MPPPIGWGILHADMPLRGITYDQFVAKLAEIGVREEPKDVRNKVACRGFSAVFFVQCLKALGCEKVQVS